jgi:transcriptional enhancer factor
MSRAIIDVWRTVLNSLTQHYNLGGKPLGQRSSSSSASSVTDGSLSPTSPLSSSSSFPSGCSPSPDTSVRRTYVCIDLLPMDPHAPCSAYGTEHFHDASTPTDSIFSSNGETDIFRPSSRPRTICSIDPTITFVSQSVISAQSSCSVLLDGATVHHEVTPLTLAGPCPDSRRNVDCPLLYGVQLVPSYWRLLCQCPGKHSCHQQDLNTN